MSKEQILEAELDKITDKVFAYGASEKKVKAKKEKKKVTAQKENSATDFSIDCKR